MVKMRQLLRRAALPNVLRPSKPPFSPRLRTNASYCSPPLQQSHLLQLLSRNARRTSVRHLFQKRLNSNKPPYNPTPDLNSPEPSLSLSQRLKKLSREYGWSALGVYLLLTALDFPFCFLAVRWLGTDRIGHWEHVLVAWFWSVVPYPFPARETPQAVEFESVGKKAEEYGVVSEQNEVSVPGYDHGVKEAEKRNQSENASKCY